VYAFLSVYNLYTGTRACVRACVHEFIHAPRRRGAGNAARARTQHHEFRPGAATRKAPAPAAATTEAIITSPHIASVARGTRAGGAARALGALRATAGALCAIRASMELCERIPDSYDPCFLFFVVVRWRRGVR
jgi:hypothetical protein